MPVSVNHELCIGCGACAAVCPVSFQMNAEGKSDPVTQEVTECTKAAADGCPVQAISVE